jgi:hypothetical protein
MWEEIVKAIPIYFSAMIKFIVGPVGGYMVGLSLFTTIITTVASMMSVVLAFSFFGEFLRTKVFARFFVNRKKFSERNRKVITFWRKYGLPGVAALTPILLTPIGGTLIALSFGTPREKLILYMFVSAAVWSVVLSGIFYIVGAELISQFNIQWTP